MNKKNSIQFTGRAGLLFTDENGMTYRVNSEILASKQYDMAIFTKDMEPKDTNNKLEDKGKESIVIVENARKLRDDSKVKNDNFKNKKEEV